METPFLREIHTEFPQKWKEENTAALFGLIDGLKTRDEQKQFAAAMKYNGFSEWVQNHAHEMRILQ